MDDAIHDFIREEIVSPPVSHCNRAIRLRNHVKWCYIDDTVIILDTLSGQYFGLPPERSNSWLTLFANGADGLSSSDHPDRPDDRALIVSLRQRAWVVDPDEVDRFQMHTPPNKVGVPLFPALDAFYCLVKFAWLLRLLGFRAAYSQASAYVLTTSEHNVPASKSIGNALKAFHKAERFVISYRGVEDCLPRSLALFVYLRRCGFAAHHFIGVRRYPFAAHAWVEYASDMLLAPRRFVTMPDTAFLSDLERRNGFVPVAEIG